MVYYDQAVKKITNGLITYTEKEGKKSQHKYFLNCLVIFSNICQTVPQRRIKQTQKSSSPALFYKLS